MLTFGTTDRWTDRKTDRDKNIMPHARLSSRGITKGKFVQHAPVLIYDLYCHLLIFGINSYSTIINNWLVV